MQRDPNDIFALKDKEKIALKIDPTGFLLLLFEIKVVFYANHDKNKLKLENHSLDNQT